MTELGNTSRQATYNNHKTSSEERDGFGTDTPGCVSWPGQETTEKKQLVWGWRGKKGKEGKGERSMGRLRPRVPPG
jgi:hypothetical protein